MTILNFKQYKETTVEDLCYELQQLSKLILTQQARIDEIKQTLVKESVANKSSFAHHNVVVTYRKAYDRISWDSATLKELMEEVPEIMSCQKTTHIKDTASVKVI